MHDAARPDAFELEHAEVRPGVDIAYVRAGERGYPLLLVHGWPETKRIWWRNIAPLAQAGFGHERCAAAGGDLGGGMIQDLGLRFEGFLERQVLFNSILPLLGEAYEGAGIPVAPPSEMRMAGDYFVRQGREADTLAI
jgi:pimeloyl-ACP methyl ester carboxylesterase